MKKLFAWMWVWVLCLSIIGCSGETEEQPVLAETGNVAIEQDNESGMSHESDGSEAIKGSADNEVVSQVSESYYPVTIQNYNRDKELIEITFEKRPERVVAVYQNSIETLLALGVEDVIVAATGLDHEIKPELAVAFETLNYYDGGLSKEEVMGQNPDFIVSWYSFFGEKKLGDVNFWHERDVNTFIMSNSGPCDPRTLENEYTDIRNLGIVFNVEQKAEEMVEAIQAEVAKGKAFAADKEPVKTVVLECQSDGTYRIYGENSTGGDMATQVGADLVAKESGTIGAEDLVALNPDVIFTVYYAYFGGSVEEEQALSGILDNEGLSNISAVQNQRVVPMMLGEVYCSGIRTMDGVKTMLQGLYPEDYNE